MSSLTDVTNKLKKLPQDRLAQVAVAILLIYIASILANFSYLVLPGSHTAANISSPNRPMANTSSQPSSSGNVNSLTAMNIFGQYVKPQDKPAEPVAPEPVTDAPPPTSLNLTLSATVAEGNNSGLGTAIIQSGSSQGTYGIDDKIDGTTAIVRQVFSDRVILQNGMRRETLMLDGVQYDRNNIPRPIENPDELNLESTQNRYTPQKLDVKRSNPSNVKKDDRRRDKQLSRKLSDHRRDIAQNPLKLNELVRFTTVKKGGVLAGFRLNPGKSPDIFKQAGFRPGDLAVEVNGRSLTDMSAAMQVLREFKDMAEANIVVERDGIRTEILLSLDATSEPQDDGRKKSQGVLKER